VQLRVRPEEPADRDAIRAVHDAAYILFTPVVVQAPAGDWTALGLAPMAVAPEHQ
jgi:hypothetical protein